MKEKRGQNVEIRTCRVGGKRAFVTTPLNCFQLIYSKSGIVESLGQHLPTYEDTFFRMGKILFPL